MDPPSSSRVRTYEHPKPETGLAEWTSKIKALQRQVDADKEVEQKRLEEEIAAFRAARQRRSQGIAYGTPTLDSPKVHELVTDSIKSSAISHRPEPDFLAAKQKNQDDAFLKLAGKPSQAATAAEGERVEVPRATSYPKPEPVSLAQFMGGRATGPRLSRHAPQQDAHDPTQFEQRTKIDAPHPVFGRGGIALPGMVNSTTAGRPRIPEPSVATTPDLLKDRDRRLSTPGTPSQTPRVETFEQRAVSLQAPGIRSRTISTPTGTVTSDSTARPFRQSYVPPSSQSTAKSPTLNNFVSLSPKPTPSPRPVTPRQQQTPTIATPTSPPSKSISTPSLARPLLPTTKFSPHSPSIGVSTSPSLAFLKPPLQKEPTPSISRLQGRGFVQSIVQASSQLEDRTPSPPTNVDKTRPASGGRRASVLDRWQPTLPPSSNLPLVAPKPVALRKSKTIDLSSSPPHGPTPNADPPVKALRSAPSLPSLVDHGSKTPEPRLMDTMPPVNTPGLGSATTMVVYKEESPSSTVDELGVRRSSLGSSSPTPAKGRSSLPAPSGKPLAHPTKERAKLPRKHKGTKVSTVDDAPRRTVPETTIVPPTPLHNKEAGEPTRQDISVSSKLSDILSAGPPAQGKQRMPSIDDRQHVPLQSKGMVGAKALPGLAKLGRGLPTPPPPPSQLGAPSILQPETGASPELRISPTSSAAERSSAPAKHARIPSTGNRPTVMDVAQVFNEQSLSTQPVFPIEVKASEATPPLVPKSQAIASPRHINPPHIQAEKRKSSYEKYSGITLPPLTEEATPTSTPFGTLNRHSDPVHSPTQAEAPVPAKSAGAVESIPSHADEPLPQIDISVLLHRPSPKRVSNDVQTISVDVISVTGSNTAAIPQDLYIFYESEVLCIVHRFKVKSTGLVSSAVWGWYGKCSLPGDRDKHKLQELAWRYGTSLNAIHQHREPSELVDVLGGRLITRQGTRAHWSPENTCMHLARTLDGVVYIDEHDLSIKNLCSGFSYCLSVLNTIYVWHGCGSTPREREAITWYAQRLSPGAGSIHELVEGESDDDEMFWLILGNDEYAKANYWKWRPNSNHSDPQIWRINSANADMPVHRVSHILDEKHPQESVYLIDCVWELFVLVGMKARGRRLDIRLAMAVAHELSMHSAKSRPFAPPVHVLILPTQLPCDLLLSLRGVEESWLNNNDVPDHMNLLPYESALQDLSKNAFDSKALKDRSMLPLGIDSSDLP